MKYDICYYMMMLKFPDFQYFDENIDNMYHTHTIITRGLYIFYPIFEDNFFVFKEVFSENSVLMYS